MTRAAICIAVALGLSGASAADAADRWSYTGKYGPQHWGEIKADFASCASGKTQSPVDIRDAVPGAPAPIVFDYQRTWLRIVDNGHTVQVNYGPGSSIVVGGKRYSLLQFHFHHPSEETIEGKRYPMVVHLVHASADGALAVVAVLLREGAANPFIETLWTHLPSRKGKERATLKVSIDATRLLPRKRAYYEFTGSLTTPPCSEGVTWLVMATPVELSAAQIARFAELYNGNARPLQALNGRPITLHE